MGEEFFEREEPEDPVGREVQKKYGEINRGP